MQIYPRTPPYQQAYPVPPKLVLPDCITAEFRESQSFLGQEQNEMIPTGESILSQEANIGNIVPQPPLPDLHVNQKTANSAQNLEKVQWLSTYQRSFSGYGELPPIALDNYDEKRKNFPYVDQPLVCYG